MKTKIFCVAFLVSASVAVVAQSLDPALLKKPATDAWPTYHGDYSGKRFSVLDQINQSNVKQLALQWFYKADMSQPDEAHVGGEHKDGDSLRACADEAGRAGDLRSIGSGNIGATNVLRTGRKGLAAGTLALDALKATLAIVLAWWLLGPPTALAAAAGAILGHMYPVWLKFRGGKGVATYLGALIGLAWPAAIAFAVVWLAVAALTRYSSAAALTATVVSPIAMAAIGESGAALVFAALSALVWFKHSANIARLFQGSETKIGQKN